MSCRVCPAAQPCRFCGGCSGQGERCAGLPSQRRTQTRKVTRYRHLRQLDASSTAGLPKSAQGWSHRLPTACNLRLAHWPGGPQSASIHPDVFRRWSRAAALGEEETDISWRLQLLLLPPRPHHNILPSCSCVVRYGLVHDEKGGLERFVARLPPSKQHILPRPASRKQPRPPASRSLTACRSRSCSRSQSVVVPPALAALRGRTRPTNPTAAACSSKYRRHNAS